MAWKGALRAVALVTLGAVAGLGGRAVFAQTAPAPQKLTFDGNVALWTMAVKPDKTADFEKVMTKLRDGLLKSDKPERRQQAAGWKIVRVDKPMPDGTIAYVHIITPTVAGADYTIMQTLYDEFPDERQQLYEMYRGAFAANLSLATGTVVLDMAHPQAATTTASTAR
jgi:hypothetical protein